MTTEPWLDHMKRLGRMNPLLREYAERCASIHDWYVDVGPMNQHTLDAWTVLQRWVEDKTGMGEREFNGHRQRISRAYLEMLILQRRGADVGPGSQNAKTRDVAWRRLMQAVFEVGD